jgi:8-oxo-(d)GTP phosphatase
MAAVGTDLVSDRTPTVQAAGGVLWRPDAAGGSWQAALVHRPRYDDWSLPKGKLDPGEHPIMAAMREVTEETGYQPLLGAPVGRRRYEVDTHDGPAMKDVRYWAMRAGPGEFVPGAEVDALRWLPYDDALACLTHDDDGRILTAFAGLPRPTSAQVLIRHASAGSSRRWDGPDALRPLDERGRAQAAALIPLLTSLEIGRVVSADLVRCRETVRPYAAEAGLDVEEEPALSEVGYPAARPAAAALLAGSAAAGTPIAACSQGPVIPDLMARLLRQWGWPAPEQLAVKKGGWWILHTHGGRPVAVERHRPAA